jgi:hypothetical protein
MFILLVTVDSDCFDDGIGHVIIGDTKEQVEEFLSKQPYESHPTQLFEIGVSAQGVVGECREVQD